MGQTKESAYNCKINSATQQITGIWFLSNSPSLLQDSLVFSRQGIAPNNWVNSIGLYKNGDFVDAYSAPCRNDSDVHTYKGVWTLDETSAILTTSIIIDQQDKKYKISALTKDFLILQRL